MDYTIASDIASLEAYSKVVTSLTDSDECTLITDVDKPWTNIFWNDTIQLPKFPKHISTVTFSPTYFEGSIRFTDKKMFITNLPVFGPTRLLCNDMQTTIFRRGTPESLRTPTTEDSPWYRAILDQLASWCVEFKNAHAYKYFFLYTITEERPAVAVNTRYVYNKVFYTVTYAGARTPREDE